MVGRRSSPLCLLPSCCPIFLELNLGKKPPPPSIFSSLLLPTQKSFSSGTSKGILNAGKREGKKKKQVAYVFPHDKKCLQRYTIQTNTIRFDMLICNFQGILMYKDYLLYHMLNCFHHMATSVLDITFYPKWNFRLCADFKGTLYLSLSRAKFFDVSYLEKK